MAATQPPRNIVQGPHNDTYVIHFDLTDSDLDEATRDFRELCAGLTRAGLTYQVRPGEDQSLLVFACAPELLLRKTVFQSRLKDYLYGTTNSPPPLDDRRNGTPASSTFEAEDLLSVYHLVSWPASNNGAGITPDLGKWQDRVRSIFPLHNSPANKALLAKLSKRLFLRPQDLDSVRDLFGAKVAFYFAYMQTYFLFLFFPALTGVYAWAFLPAYSFAYAVITLLSCVVFIEYWKIQQDRLSVRWDVRGVGHVKINRAGFRYDSVSVDGKSGKEVYHYARWKLVARQLLQVPFFLAALGTLGVIISMVFSLEVLVSEVYDGAWKSYLEYLPTVVLAIGMPYINTFLEDMAVQLAEQENHRTQDAYELSASQKMFMLSFISNYLPILLTAFVYVPLGDVIVPQLQLFVRTWLAKSGNTGAAAALADNGSSGQAGMLFHRDPDRLRNEVIALTVTGQVSDMFEEMIVPYVKHRLRAWWRAYKLRRHQQQQRQRQNSIHKQNGGGGGGGNYYDADEKEFVPKPLGRQETLMLGPKSSPSPYSAAGNSALSSSTSGTDLASHHSHDEHHHRTADEEESTFLARARYQSTLPAYNVQDDLSEMVIQFGYLALFSPAWPLISVGFLVNNWIELRSDFLKICVEHQRPHPTRSDGIGSSWIDALDALTLLGSISTGAIVHLFGGAGGMGGGGGCAAGSVEGCVEAGAGWLSGRAWLRTIFQNDAGMPSWWSLPVTIFISEHIFLVLRGGVRVILRKAIGSDIVRHEREGRYARRQRQWEDMVREADAIDNTAEKDGIPAAVCGENESLAADMDHGRDVERQLATDREAGVQMIQEILKSSTIASSKTKKL